MPKYYTPKRPTIRFANSGSAMQYVSTQRVEKLGETPSDKATLTQDFSGAPRFPRRSYDTVAAYDPLGALAQPMAFPLGPQPLYTTGSDFTRYSFLPVTTYLQAQQHGIYDLTADNLGVYTNPETASSSLDVSSDSGSVILEVHPTSAFSASEVIQWNAYLSGVDLVEGSYNGQTSEYTGTNPITNLPVGPGVYRPSYYAKTSGENNNSLRTVYSVKKYVPSIVDVLRHPPETAPSGSDVVAPYLVSPPVRSQAYKQIIGLIDAVAYPATSVDSFGCNLNTWITEFQFGYAQEQTFITAGSGNLVYFQVSGLPPPIRYYTASIDTMALVGSGAPNQYVTMTFSNIPAQAITDMNTPGAATVVFLHGWVPLVNEISGVFINNSIYDPFALDVELTQSGRIRDVRAWVEFVHDFRDVSLYRQSPLHDDWGLQGVSVALRSPNTNFLSAHPLWNSNPRLPLRTDTTLTGSTNQFGDFYYRVPELMRNSYLLWQGHGCDDGVRDTLSSNAVSPSPAVGDFYHEFDRDIDMRTIFWDGSPTPNPRNIAALYPYASPFSTGSTVLPYSAFADVTAALYKSPTWGAYWGAFMTGGEYPDISYPNIPLTGTDTPWMLDTRLNIGGLEASRNDYGVTRLSPAPPGGWLTGRGGMLPWLPFSSTQYASYEQGSGDRMFIRPTTNTLYVMGGRTGGNVQRKCWSGTFVPDEVLGILTVDGNLTLCTNGMPGEAYGYCSLNHITIDTGAIDINNYDRERVVMIGGRQLTGSGGCNEVFVGHWISGSPEITWVRSTPLPTAIQQHSAYYADGYLYVSPGVTASDTSIYTRTSAAYSAPVDQQTGLIGSWTSHSVGGATVVAYSNILAVGSGSDAYKAAYSVDGGFAWTVLPDTTHPFRRVKALNSTDPTSAYKFIAASRDGYLGYTGDVGNSWGWLNWATDPYGGASLQWNDIISSSFGTVAVGNAIRPFYAAFIAAAGYGRPLQGPGTWRSFGANPSTDIWTTSPADTVSSVVTQIDGIEAGCMIDLPWSASNAGTTTRGYGIQAQAYDPVTGWPVGWSTLNSYVLYAGQSNSGILTINASAIASYARQSTTSIRFRFMITWDGGAGWTGVAQHKFNGYIVAKPQPVEMNAICQGPNPSVLVAVGGPTGGLQPPDPPNWRPVQAPPTNSAGLYTPHPYGCAGNNQVYRSLDGGLSWQSGAIWDAHPGSPSTTWMNKSYACITYVGGKYFAAEYYGGIVSSSDGLNWGPAGTYGKYIPYSSGTPVSVLSGATSFAYSPTLGTGNGRLMLVGKWLYRSMYSSLTKQAGFMIYSDDLGNNWSYLPRYSVFFWPGYIETAIWTGDNYVMAGGKTYWNDNVNSPPHYSFDGQQLWNQYGTMSPTLDIYSMDFTTGSYFVGAKQPLYSFFDTLTDETGSRRHFGWTTYNTNASEFGTTLSPASVLTTFRYELTPTPGAYSLVNDGGIQELGNSYNYYPVIVDNLHRAWSIGAIGEAARFSTISWDKNVVPQRPKMSAPTAGGFANNQVIGAGYQQWHNSAVAFASGVMAAGLGDPAYGAGNSWNIIGVTAFFGVGPGSGEFDTYGAQLGPANIRPVYPILEDVYAYKLTDQTPNVPGAFKLASNRSQISGYRPGLRNTEVNGTWKFLFGTAATHSFDITNGYESSDYRGIWLRQVRIETVVDQGVGVFFQNPARSRLYGRSTIVPAPDGPHLKGIQSGSAAWDIGLFSYQSYQFPDYGRTVSISANQSGTSDDYAVLTFITGALYTQLSESGVPNPSNPPWFLSGAAGRNFGTPYIPDSSMSLGTGSAEQIDAAAAQQLYNNTVNIQKTVTPDIYTTDLQNTLNTGQTTLAIWEQTITSQSQDSGSGYFPPFPP